MNKKCMKTFCYAIKVNKLKFATNKNKLSTIQQITAFVIYSYAFQRKTNVILR